MRTNTRAAAAFLGPAIMWLALLTITAAGRATAQTTSAPAPRAAQQDVIPRELALTLLNLGPGMGRNTDIRVGEVPEDVPPELIPPGSQILGSMLQFDNSVLVLGMAQAPDSAISVAESRLLAAGWTKPPVPQSPRQRGFVSAAGVGSGYEMPNVVCRGNEFVTFSSTYRRSGGSLLRVNYNRGSSYSMCRQRQDVIVARSPWEEAPMPLLRAPADAMMMGGNGMSSSGMNQVSTSTRLSTKLKPAAVVAHYDTQMKGEGWAPLSDGAIEILAARTYRKKDDKGRDWTAVLYSIASPDSGQQDVMLRLERK